MKTYPKIEYLSDKFTGEKVWAFDKLEPEEFIDNFGHLHIPKLIYNQNFNEDFINQVKENKFNLSEGVICKGLRKTKGDNLIWMTKIKTNQWLQKVKALYGEKAFNDEFF